MAKKTDKDYKKEYQVQGLRLRQVRESLGLSRPKFALMLDEQFPSTTLKNYELGYREIGISVITLMGKNPKFAPYVNFVLFGTAEIAVQAMPDTTAHYDPYAIREAGK